MREYYSIQLEDEEAQVLLDISLLTNEPVNGFPFEVDIETSLRNFDHRSKAAYWYKNHHIIGLFLYHSELKFLPNSIGNLKELRFLTLYECYKIQTLPFTIAKLQNLEQLELINGDCYVPIILMDLPDVFQELKSLKKITVFGVYILYLPNSIVELKSLEELHFEYCVFYTNREVFLKNIELEDEVDIRTLSNLPEDFGNLNSLKKITISGIDLDSIPDSIINLTSLTELNISKTGHPKIIKNLEIVFTLKSLQKLNLNGCRIRKIPNQIENLVNLEDLNLWGNSLKEIPIEITKCQNLQSLNIGLNLFDDDSVQIWANYLIDLPKLTFLRINRRDRELLPKKLLEKRDLEIKSN